MPHLNGPSRRRRARLSLSVLCTGSLLAIAAAALLAPTGEAPCPPAAHSACRTARPLAHGMATSGESALMPISRLLGSAVTGADRRRVGTVADVFLDRDGRIAAVTLDVGAFLGVPTRTVAVPANLLRFGAAGEAPSPATAAGPVQPPGEEGRLAGVMEDLMSGNGRGWQAASGDHISVNLTRPEVADLPSFAEQ